MWMAVLPNPRSVIVTTTISMMTTILMKTTTMIGHAADAVGITTRVPRHLGQIRVEVGAQRGIEARETILGAEHKMDDDEAE